MKDFHENGGRKDLLGRFWALRLALKQTLVVEIGGDELCADSHLQCRYVYLAGPSTDAALVGKGGLILAAVVINRARVVQIRVWPRADPADRPAVNLKLSCQPAGRLSICSGK